MVERLKCTIQKGSTIATSSVPKLFFLLLFLGAVVSPVMANETLGLMECYNLAVSRSEGVAISREEIAKAEAKFSSLLGHILPNVSATGSEKFQDRTTTSAGSGVGDTFTRVSTPSATITLTQPIFHGFKDFQALRAQKSVKKSKTFSLAESRRDLMSEVATAFYTVIKIEKEISTTRQMMSVVRERIHALDERIRLGKSRESESLTYETELALLEAELAHARGDLSVAYEVMSFLTGLTPHPRLVEKKTDRADLKNIAQLMKLTDDRSDVQASRATLSAAEYQTKYYKAEFFPTLDFEGNVYPYRVGFLSDIKWDATFNLSLPVFNYTLFGDVRQAKKDETIARLQLSSTQRTAGTELRQSFARYQATRSELGYYQKAVATAARSHSLQVADYELGLVTNLEVLQAQKTWLEALRERDIVAVAAALARVEVMITAGMLP